MKPSAPAIARIDFLGCTAIAAMFDFSPCIRVSPLSLLDSIASKMRDFNYTIIADESATMKSEHRKGSLSF